MRSVGSDASAKYNVEQRTAAQRSLHVALIAQTQIQVYIYHVHAHILAPESRS